MQCLIDMCQYTGKIALDLFYQRWKYDQNAIKLWIGAQALSASPDAMHHLRGLLKSDRFDASNRAHMAALTYAYLANFSLCFSAKRSGYYLFVELLAMMDASHNVVKDEMRRVLTYWQGRLDPRRNQWIKEVIDHIDGVKVFKCREISSVSFDSPLAVIISETPFVPKKEEAASPHAKQGFFKEATLPSLQRSTASSLDSQQEPEERLVPALRLADA